jgi:hypothetical protein
MLGQKSLCRLSFGVLGHAWRSFDALNFNFLLFLVVRGEYLFDGLG